MRLASVQEVGLLIVIGLLMALLTFATGSQASPEGRSLPDGATAAIEGDAIVIRGGPPDAGPTRFPLADGWGLGERFGRPFLERKERVPVPPGATLQEVRDSDAVRGYEMAAGPGAAPRVFLQADGWSLSDLGPAAGSPGATQPAREFTRDPIQNRFLNWGNLILLATSASFIAIMAVGMTAIIVLGGIDLSIGAIYALAGVAGAAALRELATSAGAEGVSVWLAVPGGMLLCCAIGAICGLVNGVASVGLRVHPFVITLGGMAVYRGIAFLISGGDSIGDLPPAFQETVRASYAGVNPVPMAVMVVVGAAGAFVFSKLVFGRRIFAIGGNETAAKYAGVPVGTTKVAVFTLAGLLAGLSAGLAMGYYGGASSEMGKGYELNVIAAAVVGGASLVGGRGSALGAVLGAIVIQLISNGFTLLQGKEILGLVVRSEYEQIVVGLAIVLAVVVDQTKQRLFAKK